MPQKAGQSQPELRELVRQASCALARLDTARLQELALCCEALNRGLETMTAEEKSRLAREARETRSGMAVFARVLQATRSNLRVMHRLRELRIASLEYSEHQLHGETAALPAADLPDPRQESDSPAASGSHSPSRRDDRAEGRHGID